MGDGSPDTQKMLIDAEFSRTHGGIALSYSHSIRPHRLDGSRTPPFQGGEAGSSPVGGTQASRVMFVAFGSWHGVMLFSHGHNLTFRYIE